MVLEAVFVCLDNSEWMRNGDYTPTRIEAQSETTSWICNTKTENNAESAVGVLSMAGKRIEVHINLTRNLGAIMTAVQTRVQVGGKINFLGGLKTAQLALKNRQNKNQRQRIIVFVGSPLEEDVKEMVKLGKNFKKNNISVDIISFGTENMTNDNTNKLTQFIQAVNASDTSHLLTLPPGLQDMSNLVLTSAICMDSGSSVGASGSASAASRSGGAAPMAVDSNSVDPNVDPELAMALRMSQEEMRRQPPTSSAKPTTSSSSSSSSSSMTSSSSSSATTTTAAASSGGVAMEADQAFNEDDMAAAIAMSMVDPEGATPAQHASGAKSPQPSATSAGAAQAASPVKDVEMTPAKPAAAAPKATGSSSTAATTSTGTSAASAAELKEAFADRDFLKGLVSSVSVGGEDLEIDDILSTLTDSSSSSSSSKPQDDKNKKPATTTPAPPNNNDPKPPNDKGGSSGSAAGSTKKL